MFFIKLKKWAQRKREEKTGNPYPFPDRVSEEVWHLERALEADNLEDYLMCMPSWHIDIRDPNGDRATDEKSMMEGIYRYYRLNPESGIERRVEATLSRMIAEYPGEGAVKDDVRILDYQLASEASGRAPFRLHTRELVAELRGQLWKSRDYYIEKKDEFSNIPFWTKLEEWDAEFQKKYGISLL